MNQKTMIAFAREVFKIEEDVHESIYRAVMEKEVSAPVYELLRTSRYVINFVCYFTFVRLQR